MSSYGMKRLLSVVLTTAVFFFTLFFATWSASSQTPLVATPPQPYLVADINTTPNSSAPSHITTLNGTIYFAATVPQGSRTLWQSDGTIAGTKPVFAPAVINNMSIDRVVATDDMLFMRASGIGGYRSLWASDGLASEPILLAAVRSVDGLTAAGDVIYFSGSPPVGAYNHELWRSDGTESGTYMVKDISPTQSSYIDQITPDGSANGAIYFSARDANGYELWRSDGTEAGTVMVKDIHPTADARPDYLTMLGDVLFFSATDNVYGRELWRSDGTTQGTYMVKNIVPTSASSSPTYLTAVGDKLFFLTKGDDLWVSDGTEAGTFGLVLSLDVPDIEADMLGAFQDKFYFVADDGTHGRELWQSDGTITGTILLKDIHPTGSSNPSGFTAVDDALYFRANGGDGVELWMTDGTAVGTRQVQDIWPGTTSATPTSLSNISGTLYFSANDGQYGRELWRSNGVGAQLVADLATGTEGANPYNQTAGDTKLFFYAYDGDSTGLWRTEVDDGNTQLAITLTQGSQFYGYPTPEALSERPATVGDQLFFAHSDPEHGQEIWVSDGSPTGTHLLTDTFPGPDPFYPLGSLTAWGETLLFRSSDGANGHALWGTDGTVTNTRIITDFALSNNAWPMTFVPTEAYAYFRAAHGNSSYLWRTDGTTVGTVPLVQLPDYSPYSTNLTFDGVNFYTRSYYYTHGEEYWRTDGTPEGTWLLKDIAVGYADSSIGGSALNHIVFGDKFYFYATDRDVFGGELWQTDGTPDNTILFKDIKAGPGNSGVERMAVVGDKLFFTASDGIHGFEPWVSDGTITGTHLLRDINPDGNATRERVSEFTKDYIVLNGLYFFVADDGIHGRELWQSNGTLTGTKMVMDINPGSFSADPRYLSAVHNTLYFQADDGLHGTELWALHLSPYAVDDFAQTSMGQAVMVPILENDSYTSLGDLTIGLASQPLNGTAVLLTDTLVYTPTFGFIGTDSLSYTLSYGEFVSDTAVVTIVVSSNLLDAVDDTAQTSMGQAVMVPILENDSYTSLGDLTIGLANQPLNGTAVLLTDTLVYTPTFGFIGTDSLSYTLSYGEFVSDTAVVTVDILGKRLYLPLIGRVELQE